MAALIHAVTHESVAVGKEIILKGKVEVIVEQGNVFGLDLNLVGLFDKNRAVHRDPVQSRNCHAVLVLELKPIIRMPAVLEDLLQPASVFVLGVIHAFPGAAVS